MVYTNKPENFNPKFTSVGCFVESEGKILLLHRQNYKPQGNTWGLPSGKVDEGESCKEGIIREVLEETGVELDVKSISNVLEAYVRYKEYDFIFSVFHSQFESVPEVLINSKEHKGSKWVTPLDALKINLIEDLDFCIKMYYK